MDHDHGVAQADGDGVAHGNKGSKGDTGSTVAGDAIPIVQTAREAVAGRGWHLMPPDVASPCVNADPAVWERFAAHWEDLVVDPYAAQEGTRRLRRYGRFLLTRTGEVAPLDQEVFVQPGESNPLYVGVERRFEPLTEAFRSEPVLYALIRLLGDVAGGLEDTAEWIVRVHPFRVIAQPDTLGRPTPEGRHKDGVTLVSSLLLGRENVTGGRSTLYDPDGREIAAHTLSEPGTLLLSDDRATWHAVSPVQPQDASRPGRRDVLVTTLTAR